LLERKRRRKMQREKILDDKVVFDFGDGFGYTTVEDVALLVWFRSKLVIQRDIVLSHAIELDREINMMEKRIETGDKTEVIE